MSWYSGGELVTGGWTSSNYAGHGILFENLPTAGENGGSPLLNDGGVNGDEVRWQLLNVTGLTVDEFNEDGSFVSTGTGSFDYRSYVNGVAVGDFTATAQSADGSIDAGGVSSFTTQSTGGALLSALSGGATDFSISSSGGAVIFAPQTYEAGGAIIFDIISSGGADGGIEPERDLPISDYGNNRKWRQSIFFRQFN